jgi:hypothetical protein
MAYTLSTVLANVQRSFPELQSVRGYDLINMVHREILAFIPELRRNPLASSITPVNGQGEYSLASYTDTVFQIEHVEYVPGSGATIALSATTVEALNLLNKTWRSDASAGSYSAAGENGPQWYVSTASSGSNQPEIVIGFYPVPGFTSGQFNLYTSQLQSADLISTDTTLYGLYSPQVYVAGTCYWAAAELRPEMAAAWKTVFAEELKKNRAFVRSKNGEIRGVSAQMHNPRDGDYPAKP